MIKVRVIRKFHDAKGVLLGYRIQDIEGNEMDVYKDQLKNAIASGQCSVVNMTLTSDGRLIGKATTAPKKAASQQVNYSGENLLEVYTNNKKIVAALVNQERLAKESGMYTEIPGLGPNVVFDVGHEAIVKINRGDYDNIKVVDGKPDLSVVRRKPFKAVKPKILKSLSDIAALEKLALTVTKIDSKYGYKISIDNYNCLGSNTYSESAVAQLIFCLIEDALATAKIKVEYIDEDSIMVQCLTGISDVRKVTKIALSNK